MALTSANLGSNLGLSKPVGLDFFDDVRPVHGPIYRISGSQCQRLCDKYLGHDSPMETFADRVRAARKAAKLNQKQLATKSGLSQTTISDIERGRNEGSRDIFALAKALKVNAEWLQRGVGLMKDQIGENPICARFAWVYEHVTDEGRAFLENAVAVASVAYLRPGIKA